ncbi:MAG TPA: thioredoxin [Kiritimatiellia bacterium]|nr:thioredoxin [Kiritimatiellia bacterium]HRZ12806.1 thioredoxin [Kiritimatiellia bacterium]HSA18242.1 thioredoxin [Kiritimatiellia bacterium]
MTAAGIVHVNAQNWKIEVADSPVPVLVDFWAEWCGPCRVIAPVLDELSGELASRLKIAKVNVDESPELAGDYGIRSIPTLLLVKGGVVQQQMVGAMSKAALKTRLESELD